MVKIDFDNFVLIKSVDGQKKVPRNVRRVFADELYTNGQGIAFHALAFKIYNGNGEQEFSDEEYGLMVGFSEMMMTPAFIDSLKALKEE